MHGIDELFDMIATEAVGGGIPPVHYFDEFKNLGYIEQEPIIPKNSLGIGEKLPPIHFSLEVVKDKDGNISLVE